MPKRIRTNGLPIVGRKSGRYAEYVIREVPIPSKWRDELAENGLSRWAANLAKPPEPSYRVTRLFRFGKRRNAGIKTYPRKDMAFERAEEWFAAATRRGKIERGLLG